MPIAFIARIVCSILSLSPPHGTPQGFADAHLSPLQDVLSEGHRPEVGGEKAGIQPLGDLCMGWRGGEVEWRLLCTCVLVACHSTGLPHTACPSKLPR